MDNSGAEVLRYGGKWYTMGASGEKWEQCLSSQNPMFIGEYSHSLDEKGRLAVPKKFRAALAKGVVITRGLDNCLFVYTKSEWLKLAEKLATLPFAQANTRAFARLMLAGAMDVEVDNQGRIMVPEYLREFGGLKKDVIVAGLYNRLEIWDATAWTKYTKRNEAASATIAEQMTGLVV